MSKLAEVEKEMMQARPVDFGPGDTVKVSFKVPAGKKEKIQSFQGVCLQIKGSGSNRTFTLRKISQGIGIERIFPLHSPLIQKIEVTRYGKVRRSKLFYLRKKVGKGLYVKPAPVKKKPAKKKARRKKRASVSETGNAPTSANESETKAKTQKPAEGTPSKEAVDEPKSESSKKGKD